VPFDPPLAHLLGFPLEEFLPSLVGLGAVLAYLRLRLSWRRSSRGASSSVR
jgi:hypothetical protein